MSGLSMAVKAAAIAFESPPTSNWPRRLKKHRHRDVTDWQICWKVDLHFHREFHNRDLFCFVCNGTYSYPKRTYRSWFWEIAQCWSGHGLLVDNVPDDTQAGVCAKCSQIYLLNVIQGRYDCRTEGCKRKIRYDEQQVQDRLANDEYFLQKFTDLTKRHQKFECQVCFEEATHSDDIRSVATKCSHDPNTCKDCMGTLMEERIKSNKLKELVCPDTECKAVLTPQDVRRYLSPECLKIYEKQLTLQALSKQPNFRWCRCGNGQIHAPGASMIEWHCVTCNHRNCFLCPTKTSGQTCEHLHAIDLANRHRLDQQRLNAMASLQSLRQEQRENTAATEAAKAKSGKRCPAAGCGAWNERIDGCGHIPCGACRANFCWGCKVIKPAEGWRHLTTCPGKSGTTLTLASIDKKAYRDGWNLDPGYDTKNDEGLFFV